MSRVYDNWEKLVEATLKRELLREIALCPSLSSSSSIDLSSRFDYLDVDDLDTSSSSSSSQVVVVGSSSSSSTGAINAGRFAARLFAAPANALAYFRTRKPQNRGIIPEIYQRQLKRFSLRELKVASDNFSDKNILGRGGFGSKVYKGRLADGFLVAIKRLGKERDLAEIQFQTEVEMFSMGVHSNILRLLGFCMTTTERVLVYPYMSNGSVASCLRERPESQTLPLDWQRRRSIAQGSARGLAYLHHHCDLKIIHRDVKAANIFLDEDFEAVVGGFWLVKLMDHKDTYVITDVCGTFCHIAPEYVTTGNCSEKTDVFGYGVMLLELITGQAAYDLIRFANYDDVMTIDWVKGFLRERKWETLVDAALQGNYIHEEVVQLIQVAQLCTQESPTKRPKMAEVVRMLEGDGLADRWEEWQKEEMLHYKKNWSQKKCYQPYKKNWFRDNSYWSGKAIATKSNQSLIAATKKSTATNY